MKTGRILLCLIGCLCPLMSALCTHLRHTPLERAIKFDMSDPIPVGPPIDCTLTNWQRKDPDKYPIPDAPTRTHPGEWTLLLRHVNDGDSEDTIKVTRQMTSLQLTIRLITTRRQITQSVSFQKSLPPQTLSVSGTIGGQEVPRLPYNVVAAVFKKNERILLGEQYSWPGRLVGTVTTTAHCPPHKALCLYYADSWWKRHGTVECSYKDGRHVVLPWKAIVPDHGPDGGLSVSWATGEENVK